MDSTNRIRPFLEGVAKAYLSRFGKDGFPNADECCFVFPNKRAGTFFLKYLKDNAEGWLLAPEVTTISDLVTDLSGRLVNNRIDLIFLLYNCYCELLDPTVKPADRDKLVPFDAFRKWGETVMKDFNEIDMQIADSGVKAEEIFANVADFRKISSSFLTEEQRKVIEEYFGYTFSDSYDSQFWNIINYKKGSDPDKDASKTFLRDKFIELWKILYPLYTLYHRKMKEMNLISSGGAYRIAVENLENAIEADDKEALGRLLPFKKMVMVGFNALSVAERKLFNNLKLLRSKDLYDAPEGADNNFADFIWDATGPVLHADKENSAGRFVRINRRHFPQPEWMEEFLKPSHAEALPASMEAVGAPSGVMQVKIATDIIRQLHEQIGDKPFDEARVALVVPDENLLLPLLYSLPKELNKVNLTMGYPLRLTAVTSFLQLLRKMQLARRDSKAYDGYSVDQVRDLLSHPLAHSIFPTDAINRFLTNLEIRHISVVKYGPNGDFGVLERIQGPRRRAGRGSLSTPPLHTIFRPLDKNASSEEVIAYLDDVLELLETVLSDESDSMLKGNLELQHVIAWREALRCFEDSISKYEVRLGVGATMSEAFRLLQAEIVAFEGEPLKGLQIMGMLETRAVDFDYLVVVGVNDRTIPGRMRQRSFIPNIIRMGYGMPPNTYQEDLFGYYFYRMMSRARHAIFIYDSRITGFTGGISRYLQQLRYIYAGKSLKQIDYKFGLSAREEAEIEISKKTPLTSRRLDEYIIGNEYGTQRSISASLLKSYLDCQVKFYYKGILDLTDNPAPTPAIDRITEGDVVHAVMQDLYVPDPEMQQKWLGGYGDYQAPTPVEITQEYLQDLLSEKGKEKILGMVKREIMKLFYHRDPDDEWITDSDIQAVILRNQICDIISYDLQFAPFYIYGVEIKEKIAYRLPDGRELMIKYVIDRIDDIDERDPRQDPDMPRRQLRIVDYKTGGSHIEADNPDQLFESNYKKDNLVQLLLYALLLNEHRRQLGEAPINFRPRIYPVGKLMVKKRGFRYRTSGKLKGEYAREDKETDMLPQIDKRWIEDVMTPFDGETPLLDDFRTKLDKCLTQLLDKEQPWHARPDINECSNCVFYSACGAAKS